MGFSFDVSVPVLTVFIQGLISFFSPCVLPLIPLYIGYLSGGTQKVGEDGKIYFERKKVMVNTLFFVIGVSFTFFLLGLGASVVGSFFKGSQSMFSRIGGVLIILFGLYQLGVFGQSKTLSKEHRLPFRLDKLAMSPVTALIMGFTFSFAWTPCVGPALSSVLLMTASASTKVWAFVLIGVYTLGFVLPFLAVGIFSTVLIDLFRRHGNVVKYTVKVGGVLMVLMGLMMFTGKMNSITGYLSNTTAESQTQTEQEEENKEEPVETLLKELGYELPEKLDFFSAEFEEMLQKAKDAKGADFYPLVIEAAVLERMVNHSAIVTGDLGTGNVLSYYYDAANPSKDTGATIVNKFATPEFQKFAEKVYEYSQKGFISPSCQSTATANDYRAATQTAGEYLFGTQSYAFGCELDFSKARGIEVAMVPETAPYMDSTSGQGAMMAISATSKNPEKALEFLNLLNTDSEVMTLVNYGVEGFTYNKNDDGTITFVDEARATYSPWTNGVGNIRILPPTDAQGADFWNKFSAYYDSAEKLPYGAFILDTSALTNEAAALGNVYAKYAFNLMSGATDPATELPKFLEELDGAGVAKFVEAAQTQLAEFTK